jgi:hypothetical protein
MNPIPVGANLLAKKKAQAIEMCRLHRPIANEFAPTGVGLRRVDWAWRGFNCGSEFIREKKGQAMEMCRLHWPIANEFATTGFALSSRINE